ncbi:MAG: heme ABC exporter ATP-binding protein CcmA [Pseudomonadota bacterium]
MKLSFEQLTVHRSEREIISGLSAGVASGEVLVVTGPNGCGKSTLLKTIAGLIKPASGKIELTESGDRSIGQCCHYLGHENALKPALSVSENLQFWQKFLALSDFGAGLDIESALELVGLPDIDEIPAGYLSAGQKRRVAIARLLVCKRPVWLLDEPTGALDKKSEARFSKIVDGHRNDGGITIAATHQPLGLKNTKKLQLGPIEQKAMS